MSKILGGSSTIMNSGLDQAAKSLRVNMKGKGPNQRILQLVVKCHGLLRRFSLESLPAEDPKEAATHITSRLHPAELMARASGS